MNFLRPNLPFHLQKQKNNTSTSTSTAPIKKTKVELSNTLFQEIKAKDSGTAVRNPVTKYIIDRVMLRWLFNVLRKWSYPQFHERMKGFHYDSMGNMYAGFDFI